MRKLIYCKLICMTLLLALTLSTNAQRRRGRSKKPTPEELAEQARKEKLELARLSTAQVVFVDSLVITKEELFEHLNKATDETGTVSEEGFVSQLGNRHILTKQGEDGKVRLYEQDLIGGEWTEEKPLEGLNDNDIQQVYPFIMPDGVTLYYAAENEEGLGGLDIYMTRYDADEGHYLKPENLGMPFNSEANDYLYIVDEYHQLGCFVTDRGQKSGNVCIYTFIPPTSRTTYNVDEVGEERLASLSAINSIQDTWTDKDAVAEAQKRIEEIEEGEKKAYKKDFEFVVNDRLTYTTLSHFRDAEVRSMAETWLKKKAATEQSAKQLSNMREKYATATAAGKEAMATKILALEADVEQAQADLYTLEKEIRAKILER